MTDKVDRAEVEGAKERLLDHAAGLFEEAREHEADALKATHPYAKRDLGKAANVVRQQAQDMIAVVATLTATQAQLAEARAGLEWYGEQARFARIIHSEGDAGRIALAADGGAKARATLSRIAPAGKP